MAIVERVVRVAPAEMTRTLGGVGPLIALVALLLGSLTLMSSATQGSAHFDKLYSALLIINAVGLLILAVLIARNLYRLARQVREHQPGARLTGRMTAVFVLLAVTPVLVVYYFSLQFLHEGIDSWFDVRIESALDDAIELSRTSLGVRMRELLKQTELLAEELSAVELDQIPVSLEDARRLSGASELTLIGPKGHIIAFSNIEPTDIVPDQPSESILVQLRQTGNYIGLDPIGDAGLHVRVVVSLPAEVPTEAPRILHGLFPVSERMSTLADTVESAYGKYQELAYLRKPLKLSFTLTLSLVLLLSLFTAVWAALYSARRMVAPLRDLALGTRAVAAGDYETQLPPSGQDEVGFLVASFNEMTRELARTRDAMRESQRQVETQRRYLEAVLGRLSSGVLTLDADARLHTINEAAAQILEVTLEDETGATVDALAARHPHLEPVAERLHRHLGAANDLVREWREEVTLFGASGRKILLFSGTGLSVGPGPFSGHVIVFDDVTTLIQAQRNAAWSEVARRLAHEIKNPLTPIQLSAERLREKYLSRMEPGEGELLDRLTRTIVQHVETLMGMVNAFSAYARTPRMQAVPVDLNELAADVLELYRDNEGGIDIDLRLDPGLPSLEADPDRLRQVLHNLVKNALEASVGVPDAAVRIETRGVSEASRRFIELVVRDAGPGFAPDIVGQVFEPYVTTKPKGTGLGLAIVKKIVEEHSGIVRAENDSARGATVVIQFPVPGEVEARAGAPSAHREAV